jgi:hypothetical protein
LPGLPLSGVARVAGFASVDLAVSPTLVTSVEIDPPANGLAIVLADWTFFAVAGSVQLQCYIAGVASDGRPAVPISPWRVAQSGPTANQRGSSLFVPATLVHVVQVQPIPRKFGLFCWQYGTTGEVDNVNLTVIFVAQDYAP